jgi:hypothetical protein
MKLKLILLSLLDDGKSESFRLIIVSSVWFSSFDVSPRVDGKQGQEIAADWRSSFGYNGASSSRLIFTTGLGIIGTLI